MYFQWHEQKEFMNVSWNCGYFLASLFVLYNLIGQLAGSAMVVVRFRVPTACALLFSIIVIQVRFSKLLI